MYVRTLTITIGLLCLAASGCENYAKEKDLARVQNSLTTIEKRHNLSQIQAQRESRQVNQRLDEIVYRQKVTEEAFSQMGRGFNTLTVAVQSAHDASERVYTAQKQFETRVAKQMAEIDFGVSSRTLPDEQQYLGTGDHKKTGAALPNIVLELREPATLIQTDTDGTQHPYTLELVGKNLYGDDGTGNWICLQLLTETEEDGSFAAALCEDPFALYQFEPTVR